MRQYLTKLIRIGGGVRIITEVSGWLCEHLCLRTGLMGKLDSLILHGWECTGLQWDSRKHENLILDGCL